MDITRKVIAILLALFVVLPLAVTTLTMVAVSGWALDRAFYQNLASDTRVYEVWQAEAKPDSANISPTADADRLPIGALGYALLKTLTPEYLRDQATAVINQSFDILEGTAASPEVFVDTAPLKATLSGPGARTFATTLAASLPACGPGMDALAPGGSVPRCRMPGETTAETARLIAAGLPTYLDKLPDPLNIANSDVRFPYRVIGIPALVMGRLGLGMGIVALALITALVMLLTALIGARSAGGRLVWLGAMLLVPAALVGVLGPLMYSALWSGWFRYSGITAAEAPYLEMFRMAMRTSAGAAVRTIANGFILTGAVAGLLGLGAMVLGALALRPRAVSGAIDAGAPAIKG